MGSPEDAMSEAGRRCRKRPRTTPADPRVRAFLDAWARVVADSIIKDLGCDSVPGSDPRPRANATPGLTNNAYRRGADG